MKISRTKIQACSYSETQQLMNDEVEDTFCVGFPRGFAVCHSFSGNVLSNTISPYKQTSFISSINDSNILAIIPKEQGFIHIWDLKKKCLLFGIPLDKEEATGLILRPDCVFVVGMKSVSIYNLYDQSQLSSMITHNNPHGAFDIPSSFSTEISAILSRNVGEFEFFSYNNPDLQFTPIKAFSREIDVLRFSPNGQIIAASSISSGKVKVYRVPEGFEIFSLKLPINEVGACEVQFDRYDSMMFVLTPSKNLYMYSLENINLTDKTDTPPALRYTTSFSLSDHQKFYAYFTSQLDTIVTISEDCVHRIIRYVKSTKKFVIVSETIMNFDTK